MKRIKTCALALSAFMMLGALAGCDKDENNETAANESETSVVATQADETTASETETQATETSASETEASATETEASESETQTTEETSAFVIEPEEIELDAALQQYANTFISNFAEQYLVSLDRATITPEECMDFARTHIKINDPSSVTYETKGDVTYETFTWEQAKKVVSKYIAIMMNNSYEDFEAPSGEYGDHPAGPFFEDGKIWYEAADGDEHNVVAVVDSIINNTDGTITLNFTVYEIDIDTFLGLDSEGLKAYYKKTSDEAKADSTLTAMKKGTALATIGQSGDYYLYTYQAG